MFTFRFARSLLWLAPSLALPAASLSAQDRVLTKAIEVRSLSVAEAEQGLPVRLRGVVVFAEVPSSVFLQDETSTTFFQSQPGAAPAVGDELEVEGTTRMGLYLPGIGRANIRLLGHRALPPGIPARYDDLIFGRYHYQRVEVEGIVRSVSLGEANKSVIRLAMGSRVIEARVEAAPEAGRLLVDHRVRITGLAAGLINRRRQLVLPYLRVVGWNEVETLAPAPPTEQVPRISAEELLAFRVAGHGERRVRIAGVVTAVFRGEQIFLRQGDAAYSARLTEATTVNLGDRVELIGFPEMDGFDASVADAAIVSREAGPEPAAVRLNSTDEITELHDGNLIAVAGTVRDAFKIEGGNALLIQGRNRTVQARLSEDATAPDIGTQVRLTGICQIERVQMRSGFSSQPGLVTVRTRSAADLTVLQTPSWWTPRRLAQVLGLLAAVVLLAALWIAVLRRQVGRQTEALRKRIEAEAALEERQRIAREFHDTLEQELAGVSLRLDALATREMDEKGRNLIGASRSLVSRIQTETRDLIGDLRDPAEAAGDLAAALAAVAARHSAESGADVQCAADQTLPPLPAGTVHDLRMIAREAVTNALKHGRANHVTIETSRRGPALAMSVTDNGGGFDPAQEPASRRGHFGCAGIRERARKIGAQVTWRSAPGAGATLEVIFSSPIAPGPKVPREE
ncbi:MAG: sensor histidine kinase [Opitutaceae bacterium]